MTPCETIRISPHEKITDHQSTPTRLHVIHSAGCQTGSPTKGAKMSVKKSN